MAEIRWKDNMSIDDKVLYYKSQLQKTDYQILKCVECFFCGEELPYDIKKLHEDKNQLRDMVESLENLLNKNND